MDSTAWPWLDLVATRLSGIAIALLVLLNAGFAARVFLSRDRSFVNRWMKPLVVADATLVLVAGGMPVANAVAQRVIGAVATVMPDVTVLSKATPAPVSPDGE